MSDFSVCVVQIAGPGATDRLVDWLAAELPRSHIEILRAGTVPARRAQAVRRGRSEALLLVEDTVRPAGGWRAAVDDALGDPALSAASGPLRCPASLPPRVQAWAAHEYRLDDGTGARAMLPGHLLLLRRQAALAALDEDGLREDTFFPRLHGGKRLVHGLAAEIVAADPRGASIRGQARHGRGWAGRQRSGWPRRVRAARVLGWPALACLRTARSLDRPLDLPVRARVAGLACGWAVGEAAGTLLGPGSEEHWR